VRNGVVVGCMVATLGVSACGGGNDEQAAAGGQKAKTKVNFVLNFTPGPQHEEFVVAKYKGYYDRAGLDVNMTTPAATTDPIKLVASGTSDVGIAYAGDVISAAAQDVPVEAVATIHRRIALGLASKPGSGIKTPQDLIGKTVGLTPIPNNRAMFQDFLKKNHVDPAKVKVVPVNFNGPQLLAAGKIDACDAVSWYENGVYKQLTGKAPSYLEFTRYGVPDGYFFTIITSKRYLASHKDAVKKFVAATLEAEKWTLENPDAANQVLVGNVKDVSLGFAKSSRGILKSVVVDADSKAHGIGWSNPDVWARQAKFYLDSGQIKKAVDTASIFTNDLLPAKPVQAAG
jgi:ABC-type nitrate/sulfonate/bicarbonate transport system substrate-binding protein